MPDFVNPVGDLQDIAHVFEEGARTPGGITVDQDLCLFFAAGLEDAARTVKAFVSHVESVGLLDRIAVVPADDRPRTPVERVQLARTILREHSAGRVVHLPELPRRTLYVSQGGSAA